MRTCVGCRRQDESDGLIRLVIGEDGAVAVDLAGRAFGRGAWVHARPDCLARASRGGAEKGLKHPLRASGASLVGAVRAAADRRVEALLGAARGAGKIASGSDVAEAAFQQEKARLVVVALDARAAAQAGWVTAAAAAGKVALWGAKERLGRALGKPDVAVVAVLEDGFARALTHAIALSHLPGAPGEAAESTSEANGDLGVTPPVTDQKEVR